MAPLDNSPIPNINGFELICSFRSNDTIPVHNYKSSRTGITVFICEVEGPLVAGYFCVATECFDNDGLPHSLEHLIFFGSEDYPYNGVLDLVGNRCLASGTTAWTDTDHTNFTMTTVGSAGFLILMPVYLDHILFPTLTDVAFLTEVYHINGDGEDGGIIYCEMQSKENKGERLSTNELRRHIYPGRCGYKSIVGGLMRNLRESTSNEKIKAFHREYYRPENLTIIITGQVNHADVFKALGPLEQKILSKPSRGIFQKPWQSPVPWFRQSVEQDILYPCDDEDSGIVSIGWRGPSSVTDFYDVTGCSLLLKYLMDNSVSPLQKAFVEIDDPYACNVNFNLNENSVSLIHMTFSGVPIQKIPLIKDQLIWVLTDIYINGIDMNRMATVITRRQLEVLSHIETITHDSIAFMLVGYVLYGRDIRDLDMRLNSINMLNKLAAENKNYWMNLLKNYFIDAPMVVIRARPSIKKQMEIAEAEKKRVAKRRKTLGMHGLKQKEKELSDALARIGISIPDEILNSFPVPGTHSINFHTVKSFMTGNGEQHPRFDVNELPWFTCLDNLNTNFINIFVVMNTSNLTRETRPYIPLILEAIGECPIVKNGIEIPYGTVVAGLEADTIGINTQIGFEAKSIFSCGAYSHCIHLMLRLEMSKYNKGIQWIRDLLYDTKYDVSRLKIVASRLLRQITVAKKKGGKICADLMKGLLYSKDSNHYSASPVRQEIFLMDLLEKLSYREHQSQVVDCITRVMRTLTETNNMMIYMATNIDRLSRHINDLYGPWDILSNNEVMRRRIQVPPDWMLHIPQNQAIFQGCILGLGCVESSFLFQSCPSLNYYEDSDLAPLLVCLQYLTQLEGPIWKQVRSQGLAYSCNIFLRINEGLLYFVVSSSANILTAYKRTKTIIDDHIANNLWERVLYDSAKSSLIFETVDREKSIGETVYQSLLSYFRNVSHNYNRQMVDRIYAVEFEELNRVAYRYIKPLFDPNYCKTTIVCHPSKVSNICLTFRSYNHNLEVFKSLKRTYLNTW